LDAIGLICDQVSRVVPPPGPNGKVVGRFNTGYRPPPTRGNICDSAAAARARNSPAAPNLEAQCKAAAIPLAERADLTPGPNGVPVSICDAAQAALDRLAPDANDLVSKCIAAGGQYLISPAEQNARDGAAAALRDQLLSAFRRTNNPRRPSAGLTLESVSVESRRNGVPVNSGSWIHRRPTRRTPSRSRFRSPLTAIATQ